MITPPVGINLYRRPGHAQARRGSTMSIIGTSPFVITMLLMIVRPVASGRRSRSGCPHMAAG